MSLKTRLMSLKTCQVGDAVELILDYELGGRLLDFLTGFEAHSLQELSLRTCREIEEGWAP